MNKIFQKVISTIIGIVICGIGVGLTMKAAIGVGAWDALSQSISLITDIKVGTMSMIFNIMCVFIQLLILKNEFKINHAFQMPVAILLGNIVNFMFYDVYSQFIIDSYIVNLVILILSIVICAMGVAMIMSVDFITFPLESCCMVVAKKINKNFSFIRQSVDIISITLAILISLIAKNNITVREGTIIATLIYAPMVQIFMNIIQTPLRKLHLEK